MAILRCVAANEHNSTTYGKIDKDVFYSYGDVALLSMLLDKMTAAGLLTEPAFSRFSLTAQGRELMDADETLVFPAPRRGKQTIAIEGSGRKPPPIVVDVDE
jgi:hypothetical protein